MSLRTRLDGNGLLVAVVVALLLVSTFSVYTSLSGPTAVQWTGAKVHGVNRDGIVYYSWSGVQYTIDDTTRFDSTTVAFRPSDPAGTAILVNNTERWVEVGGVVLPGIIAVAIVAITLFRRRRWRDQLEAGSQDGFGRGLDPEVVQRLIEKRRQGR